MSSVRAGRDRPRTPRGEPRKPLNRLPPLLRAKLHRSSPRQVFRALPDGIHQSLRLRRPFRLAGSPRVRPARPQAAPRTAHACPARAAARDPGDAARVPSAVSRVPLAPHEDLDGDPDAPARRRRRPAGDGRSTSAEAARCRRGWRPASGPSGASRSGRAPWPPRARRRRPARRRRSPCARRRGRRRPRRRAARRARASSESAGDRGLAAARRAGAGAARAPRLGARRIAPSTVASWKGSRACGQRALDQRDHDHRLAEAHHAADAGDAHRRDRAAAACGPEATSIVPVAGADGGRPVRRPVDEQPVAQRHAAEAQLPSGVAVIPAAPSSRRGSSARRTRDRARRCARRASGPAARSRRGSSRAAGRSRRRRTPGRRRGRCASR